MEPKKPHQTLVGDTLTPSGNHPHGRSIDGVVSAAPQLPPPNPSQLPIPVPQQVSQPIMPSQPSGGDNRFSQLRGFFSFVVFITGVLIAAFFINQFVFQSYYVDGTSMVPTLKNGDRLIIEKVGRTIAGVQSKPYIPERGQIVVLDSNLIAANGSHEQLIKRVIGLPGDTISIKDGVVIVKNKENPDGFDVDKQLGLVLEPTYSSSPQEFEVVPEGHVFVMGDNRTQNASRDSRSFGSVKASDLEGHLWARILPVNHAQTFP